MPDFNFTSKNLKQSSSLQFSLFCLNSLSHCKANEPLTCVFLLALWLHMIYELTIHPSEFTLMKIIFFSIVNQITQRCPKESSHCFMVTSILKIRFYIYVCLFMRLKFALSYVLIFPSVPCHLVAVVRVSLNTCHSTFLLFLLFSVMTFGKYCIFVFTDNH